MNTNAAEPEYIRAFIAIDTSDELKQKLGRVQEELRRLDDGVRWVAPGILHFTLIFLGDIRTEQVAAVAKAMDDAGSQLLAFPCEVTGMGYFGSRNSPRVIWAGIRADPVLATLNSRLSEEIRKLGIDQEDRPFKPHLTIGRVRSIRNKVPFMRKIESYGDTAFGQFNVNSMLLIRSILKPQGPDYSTLHTTTFAGVTIS